MATVSTVELALRPKIAWQGIDKPNLAPIDNKVDLQEWELITCSADPFGGSGTPNNVVRYDEDSLDVNGLDKNEQHHHYAWEPETRGHQLCLAMTTLPARTPLWLDTASFHRECPVQGSILATTEFA